MFIAVFSSCSHIVLNLSQEIKAREEAGKKNPSPKSRSQSASSDSSFLNTDQALSTNSVTPHLGQMRVRREGSSHFARAFEENAGCLLSDSPSRISLERSPVP